MDSGQRVPGDVLGFIQRCILERKVYWTYPGDKYLLLKDKLAGPAGVDAVGHVGGNAKATGLIRGHSAVSQQGRVLVWVADAGSDRRRASKHWAIGETSSSRAVREVLRREGL